MESGRYGGQRRYNDNNVDIGGRNMEGKNMKGVRKISELTSFLDLTSVYGAQRDNVISRGVTLLVNATEECPKQEIPGVESIKIPLGDNASATINRYFDYIADKINEHALRGGRAMVHCVRGRSRSATLCLAYLMKYHNMNLNTALEFVAARRPIIKPNSGFRRQLKDYEVKLNGGRVSSDSYGASVSSQQQYQRGGFDNGYGRQRGFDNNFGRQSPNFGYQNSGRQSPVYGGYNDSGRQSPVFGNNSYARQSPEYGYGNYGRQSPNFGYNNYSAYSGNDFTSGIYNNSNAFYGGYGSYGY